MGLKEYATELKQIHTMNRIEEDIRVSKVEIDIESLNGNVRRRETLMTIKDMLITQQTGPWYNRSGKIYDQLSFLDWLIREIHMNS